MSIRKSNKYLCQIGINRHIAFQSISVTSLRLDSSGYARTCRMDKFLARKLASRRFSLDASRIHLDWNPTTSIEPTVAAVVTLLIEGACGNPRSEDADGDIPNFRMPRTFQTVRCKNKHSVRSRPPAPRNWDPLLLGGTFKGIWFSRDLSGWEACPSQAFQRTDIMFQGWTNSMFATRSVFMLETLQTQ